jgi:HEAT repeat protein
MPRLVPLAGQRDHSIRSPEPVLTERFGVPNACNACHVEETAAWAREAREKWWGPADETRVRDTALVADLRKGPVAAERAEEVLRGPRSPLFFRATALRALPQGHAAVREALGSDEVGLVQVACEALAARPDPLAAPALLKLLGHPARTVRVEAAHALARAGWLAAEPQQGLYDAARELLVRQYATTPLLVRAAWILDAIGASEDMSILLPTIAERSPADAAPLIVRRGRALAQAGQHAQALIAFDDARRMYGDAVPGVVYVDSADSLAATGEVGAAETVWRHAVGRVDPASVEHAIARAWLLGVEGRGEEGRALLAPFAARLAEDPAGADMLRRVRWSMDALGR